MKTSIIILTFNQLEYTKKCIDSIRKYTAEQQYEIIIVDNKSTDGTVKWLYSQQDMKVVYNQENLGFPKGCNQGIEIAEGDNILLLNNDTIVTFNWLNNLITCLYSDESVGAVGAVTNNCSYGQTIQLPFSNEQEMQRAAKKHNCSNPGLWEFRLKLVGYCMLIKRRVLDQVGMLDERFSPGNYEDDDLSLRIVLGGFKLMLCKDTFIYHFGSISFKKNPVDYCGLLEKNRSKFIDKWGFDPNHGLFIRQEIISLMKMEPDKEIKVLEVGCACGATLLKIKSMHPDVNLYGIELNAKAAEIARHFAEVSIQNIEKEGLSYEEKNFDYIIFSNVLEYFYHPGEVLQTVRKYLKVDGKILACIPNLMHVSRMKQLLSGHWNQANAGNTELPDIHLFILEKIHAMFLQAGYVEMQYTAIHKYQNEDDQALIKSLAALGGADEKMFTAYQYLVQAGKEQVKKEAIPVNEKGVNNEQQMTFLLRRIENEIHIEENIKKLMDLLIDGVVLPGQVSDSIIKNMIKKQQLFNVIAWQLFKQKQVDKAVFLLEKAYKLDKQHTPTVCNLAYIMNAAGDKSIALTLLHNLSVKDDQVRQLMDQIEGKVS